MVILTDDIRNKADEYAHDFPRNYATAYRAFIEGALYKYYMMDKKYNVIYADPPWEYKQKETGGTKTISGALDKYGLMTMDKIKELNIASIADKDAILFLWATIPLLPDIMNVIPSWGFKYKTAIIWEKQGVFGMGNWLRTQVEIMLIATRGKVKPFKHQEKNIYKHHICDHSAKPHFFRELVMKLADKSFDKCNRLELFARSRKGMFSDYEYEGWDVFGNEVNNSIKLPIFDAK